MSTLNTILEHNGPELQALKQHLNELGDYDDPFLVLIHTKGNIKKLRPYIVSEYLGDEHKHFQLMKDMLLLTIFVDSDDANGFIEALMTIFDADNTLTHIAVFHHNSLGAAWETFDWTTQLLEEIEQKSPDVSRYEFNDFSDHDNWPGIDKYMSKRNTESV